MSFRLVGFLVFLNLAHTGHHWGIFSTSSIEAASSGSPSCDILASEGIAQAPIKLDQVSCPASGSSQSSSLSRVQSPARSTRHDEVELPVWSKWSSRTCAILWHLWGLLGEDVQVALQDQTCRQTTAQERWETTASFQEALRERLGEEGFEEFQGWEGQCGIRGGISTPCTSIQSHDIQERPRGQRGQVVSAAAQEPSAPLTPPPGNHGTPQQFMMGTPASMVTTPTSLKAVELPLPQRKDGVQETKEAEVSDVSALAAHLNHLMIQGTLNLPDHLQSTLQTLVETEPPKVTSMYVLENQRRKWQKRLTQNQEKLVRSQEAWQKFIADVTKHLAAKEEQFRSIVTQTEKEITEATTKLQEIAQAMKEHITQEPRTPQIEPPLPAVATQSAVQLKETLTSLQQEQAAVVQPLSTQNEEVRSHDIEINSQDGDHISVGSEDEAPWQTQKNRGRSRSGRGVHEKGNQDPPRENQAKKVTKQPKGGRKK